LIGEKHKNSEEYRPMRFGADGLFIIPGATLRGLIRSAVEIVAYGKLGASNLHHRYGLRDFEHPAYGDGGSPVSRVKEVHAGWLEWVKTPESQDASWQITPCDWAHIEIDNMLTSRDVRWATTERGTWVDRKLEEKYSTLSIKSDNGYNFKKTFGFSTAPEDHDKRFVTAGGPREGVFVFAGRLPKGKDTVPNKKFEYVFFDRAEEPPVQLKHGSVETFKRLNSKQSANRPEPDGSFKDLQPTLKNGGRVPVFYVGDLAAQDKHFAFGLTRLFKVPHNRSVGDVLAAQGKHLAGLTGSGQNAYYAQDFIENVFGYVVEPDKTDGANDDITAPGSVARKGRIAFGFATLNEGEKVEVSAPVAAIMLAPRGSFAPFYLKSNGEKDYSAASTPKLAGRKRYLPRWTTVDAQKALKNIRAMGQAQIDAISGNTTKVQSKLCFLMPKTTTEMRFRSKIRLHNVTAAELGAVLFALTHGGDVTKPYRHMVGRAKPFGAGQMRVGSATLAVEANDGSNTHIVPPSEHEFANATGTTGFCVRGKPLEASASHRPFLDAFVKAMREATDNKAFPDTPAVLEFLGVSDPAEGEKLQEAKRLEYLPLKDFNTIRKTTKPMKPPQGGGMAPAPAQMKDARDGRYLPAPTTTRTLFWK
jgi:CRISPR-associated protein (TIGR03986 family)